MTEQLSSAEVEVVLPPVLHAVPDPDPDPNQAADPMAFAEAVAGMAVDWQSAPESRLHEIVSGAVGVVPGCEFAALVVFDADGMLVAKAVSGPETGPMIALQNELRQGPCRQTAATNEVLRSADVQTDLRWPQFSLRAAAIGIGSMLCTPLTVGRRAYGSLSMAASSRHAFDAESESLAAIFATHAAVALAAADKVESLTQALDTRDLIGQAKGILMGRYGISADAAFSVLVRESKDNNIKLRTVSEDFCRTMKLPSDGKEPRPSSR